MSPCEKFHVRCIHWPRKKPKNSNDYKTSIVVLIDLCPQPSARKWNNYILLHIQHLTGDNVKELLLSFCKRNTINYGSKNLWPSWSTSLITSSNRQTICHIPPPLILQSIVFHIFLFIYLHAYRRYIYQTMITITPAP